MKRLITHDYNNKGGKKLSIYITITEVSTVNFIICLLKFLKVLVGLSARQDIILTFFIILKDINFWFWWLLLSDFKIIPSSVLEKDHESEELSPNTPTTSSKKGIGRMRPLPEWRGSSWNTNCCFFPTRKISIGVTSGDRPNDSIFEKRVGRVPGKFQGAYSRQLIFS